METTADTRMRSLYAAMIALASELSLDALLQRLVETAAATTGAHYAALGVIDHSGHGLERFITYGIDEGTRTTIGDPPHGRGILGVLIRDATPLRLHNLSEDPRSVGFPPGHPPMRTFLGVPVMLRGAAFGNLYLTEKAGGEDFTEEDEELVTLLASQAAVAIENARLYETATRWSRQLESLHEIIRALAEETELERLLELICARLRELVDARLALVVLPSGDDELVFAAGDGAGADVLIGQRLRRSGSKVGRVLDRRHSARVDNVLEDPEFDREAIRLLDVRDALIVPLIARGHAIGVVAVHDKVGGHFTDADLRLAEIFAARAAVAVDLSERVARDTVRRVLDAQEQERKRLALELHDETGQALTSILLGLKAIRGARDPESAAQAEANLRELVVAALQEVRGLAVELRPASLDDFGLVPALERLVASLEERSGMRVALEATLDERLSPELETVLYRVVQEALTNVVKHANATSVSVVVGRRSDGVTVVVEDNGKGFDPGAVRPDALGLLGMRERLALVDGTLAIESAPRKGSTFIAFVPMR